MWFKKKKIEKQSDVVVEDGTRYLIDRKNTVSIPVEKHSFQGMLGDYVSRYNIYFRKGSEPICDKIIESAGGNRRFYRELEVDVEGNPIGFERIKEPADKADLATKKQVDEMVLQKKKKGRPAKAKK